MLLLFQSLSSTKHLMPFSYSSGNTIVLNIPTKEMLRISLDISRAFAPTAPIKATNTSNQSITSSELLKVSQNISQYYSPKTISNTKKLTMLAVNPQQLYIYWNLGINNSPSLLPSISNNELMLRIYSQSEKDNRYMDSELIFEKVIHTFQHQQKISIPVAKGPLVYSAYIGNSIADKDFTSVIKSNELHILKGDEPFLHPLNESSPITNNSHLISSSPASTNTLSSYANSNRSGQGKKSLNHE